MRSGVADVRKAVAGMAPGLEPGDTVRVPLWGPARAYKVRVDRLESW
jgi:hypothetical protein